MPFTARMMLRYRVAAIFDYATRATLTPHKMRLHARLRRHASALPYGAMRQSYYAAAKMMRAREARGSAVALRWRFVLHDMMADAAARAPIIKIRCERDTLRATPAPRLMR